MSHNIPAIKCLLKRDPSVVNQRTSKRTPLHHAVMLGNRELVEFLLQQDEIDLNIKNFHKETADAQECCPDEFREMIKARRKKK